MKAKKELPMLNEKSFYNFVKLNLSEQIKLLKEQGIFLDRDNEKETVVNLYFLNGFFVEETVLTKEERTLEILAFKQGYRVEKYLEIKEVLTLKKN